MINFMISKISDFLLLKKKALYTFLSTLFSQNDWKVLKTVTRPGAGGMQPSSVLSLP